MFFSFLSYFFHYTCFNLICSVKSKKISNNIVSGIHAFSSVFWCLIYFLSSDVTYFTISKNFSSGYFLFDIEYMIKNRKKDFYFYCMSYHHISAIYGFYQPMVYFQPEMLFLAEISNLPNYFVYHAIQNGDEVKKLKILQKMVYVIFRVFFISYCVYMNYFHSPDRHLFYVGFPVYLMGLGWSRVLLKN